MIWDQKPDLYHQGPELRPGSAGVWGLGGTSGPGLARGQLWRDPLTLRGLGSSLPVGVSGLVLGPAVFRVLLHVSVCISPGDPRPRLILTSPSPCNAVGDTCASRGSLHQMTSQELPDLLFLVF